MILQNLSVHKWSVRALRMGIAFSLLVSFYSCNNDDEEDLIGNWVKISDFDGVARSEAVAVSLGDKAYIATGYDGEIELKDIWEFNAGGESWTQKAFMPAEAAARHSAIGFGANGKVYVGTGYDGDNELNDFWEYDPALDVWTPKAPVPGGGRRGAIAFSIGNMGYVGTGLGDGNLVLKDFYAYNPANDSWETRTSVIGSKRRDALAFVIGEEGYVVTGFSNDFVSDFAKYSPETNTWTKLRNIADVSDESFDDDYNIARTNAVAFSVGGKGYIATGGRQSTGSDIWEYNPATDLWIEKTAIEGAPRMEAVAFTVNDAAYVATGRSSSNYYFDIWLFQPNAEQNDNDNYY